LLLAGTTFLPAPPESTPEFLSQLALQSATLFAGCMICHGEIVRLQPTPARLPKFYLAIAAGGALGGALVTLVAPLAFSDYFEHPLVLCTIAALAATLVLRQTGTHRVRWLAPAAASLAALYFLGGLGVGVWRELAPERALVERVRNFYGVVKVLREVDEDTRQSSLVMQQAGVDQGAQYQSPERRMEPACGFDKASALGLAVAHNARRRAGGLTAPVRIGVVGLGAGMIAAHGRAGDVMRYYELNPSVLDLVDRRFTFLKEGKARTDVLLGDGRLVLERQLRAGEAQGFDILVLNAFRGASPPMHLMTKEAFDIYLAHLATDGILAVNFEFEMFEMAPLHTRHGQTLRHGRALVRPQGRRRLRRRDQLGAVYARQGLLRGAAGQGRGLPLARPRQPARPGLDRQRQQPDEHHQLARRGHGRASAGIGSAAHRTTPLRYALGAGCAGGECRIGFHPTAWARRTLRGHDRRGACRRVQGSGHAVHRRSPRRRVG
jgi:hypothetical protein